MYKQLQDLLKEIYNQGYICGINDDRWFIAYANAVMRIMEGAEFSEELVDEEYHKLIDAKLTGSR